MELQRSRRSFFCLAALAWTLALAGPALAATELPQFADEVYTRTNAERASLGLEPLARIKTVELAASLHAMDMANREYMSHYTQASPSPVVPDPVRYPAIAFAGGILPWDRADLCGFRYTFFGAGENVAWNGGYGAESPRLVVAAWMGSEGHRANILHTAFKGIGIGCAQSASGRVYYCQVFVAYVTGQQTIQSNSEIWGAAIDTTAPDGWNRFAPAAAASLTPSCTVRVSDGGSGLKVASASYRFLRGGEPHWSDWQPASCTGTAGTTEAQQITAAGVPFNIQSRENRIQFRIWDEAGNVGLSPVYDVTTDTEAPGSWTNFAATRTGDTTASCSVQVQDLASGLNVLSAGYFLSTDGGVTWSEWRVAVCTGAGGSTAFESVSASDVPVGTPDSATPLIRFYVEDRAGNHSLSPAFGVTIAP